MTAALYGASWCGPCKQLDPIVSVKRAYGYKIEYRDVDDQPSPYVTTVTAVFIYKNGVGIDKAVGPAAITKLLNRYLP